MFRLNIFDRRERSTSLRSQPAPLEKLARRRSEDVRRPVSLDLRSIASTSTSAPERPRSTLPRGVRLLRRPRSTDTAARRRVLSLASLASESDDALAPLAPPRAPALSSSSSTLSLPAPRPLARRSVTWSGSSASLPAPDPACIHPQFLAAGLPVDAVRSTPTHSPRVTFAVEQHAEHVAEIGEWPGAASTTARLERASSDTLCGSPVESLESASDTLCGFRLDASPRAMGKRPESPLGADMKRSASTQGEKSRRSQDEKRVGFNEKQIALAGLSLAARGRQSSVKGRNRFSSWFRRNKSIEHLPQSRPSFRRRTTDSVVN